MKKFFFTPSSFAINKAGGSQDEIFRQGTNKKSGGDGDSRPTTPDKYFLTQDQIDEYIKRDKIEQKGAQEIRLTNDLYNRVIVVECICVIFSSFSMALSVMLYELSDNKNHRETENSLQYYNAFCTFALSCAQYFKYNIYLKWFISRNLFSEHDSLLTTGWWRSMTFEIILMLLAPYPHL